MNCENVFPGSSSNRGASTSEDCQCLQGSFLRPGVGCINCLEGLLCPGGNDQPLQQAGYWVAVTYVENRYYSVTRCRNNDECPEGIAGTCAEGRRGTACNNCQTLLYTASKGQCNKCDDLDFLPFVVTAVIALLLCLGLGCIVNVDAAKQRLSLLTVFLTALHLATTVQALGVFQRLQINWIEPVKSILSITALLAFDFDVVNMSCFVHTDDPVMKFTMRLLVYPCFVVALVLTAAAYRLCGRRIEFDALVNSSGLILLIAYIPLTLSVCLPFQCAGNPDGTSSTGTNPGVACWDSEQHRWLASVGAIGIV